MTTLPKDVDAPTLDLPAPDRTNALVLALIERFDMDEEDAHAIAEVVSEKFGGEEEVNDDTLDPEVRSIFYTLEAKKLVSFRREEYSIETGERRRAFFWRLRDEELAQIHGLKEDASEESIYDALPKSAWSRNAS